MEPEVDCIRQQNNQTLNLCNMHLEIGKIKKEYLDSLWISRINAASRMLGVSYSSFSNGLSKKI